MIDLAVVLAVSNLLHRSQLAYNRPRVMLPVLGKPMLIRTMERLRRAGIQKYIVVVGENEGAVASYLQKQWLPNADIEFVIQPHTSNLVRILADITTQLSSPFLITTYNCFTHMNFPETLLKRFDQLQVDLLLAGASTSLSKSYRNVFAESENGLITNTSHQKPSRTQSLAISNLAICGQDFIQFTSKLLTSNLPSGNQLVDIFLHYFQSGEPTSILETAWLLQIEADYDLLTLNQQLLQNGQDSHILSEIPPSVQIIPPIRIDPNVSVGQGAKLGPCVYLESGCSIGQNSKLDNTLVLENTLVPANSRFSNSILANQIRITNPDML